MGQIPQIIPLHCQHVEGVKMNLFIVSAGMQSVKIGASLSIAANARRDVRQLKLSRRREN
jgi:hypothetical protein